MSVVETLKAARNLISDEKRWTKRFAARTKSRRECRPTSPNAVCWCAVGAIVAVAKGPLFDLQQAMEKQSSPYSLQYFNDHHTHAEVLAAFDEAIRVADTQIDKE